MNATSVKPAFNPWPYALIVFFTLFVSSVVGFGIWAVGQKSELVGADYYEQEVRFQRQIDSAARTQAAGRPVNIAYRPEARQILVGLPPGTYAPGTTGMIRLYRPADASLDRELALVPDAGGQQVVDASELKAGNWKVRLHWTSAGADHFAEQTLLIAGAVPRK